MLLVLPAASSDVTPEATAVAHLIDERARVRLMIPQAPETARRRAVTWPGRRPVTLRAQPTTSSGVRCAATAVPVAGRSAGSTGTPRTATQPQRTPGTSQPMNEGSICSLLSTAAELSRTRCRRLVCLGQLLRRLERQPRLTEKQGCSNSFRMPQTKRSRSISLRTLGANEQSLASLRSRARKLATVSPSFLKHE